MTGILPNNGVPADQTQNSLPNPNLSGNCDNLWYAARCNPRMDPFAMNAVISEIINLVNSTGMAYDCSRLDNLSRALAVQPVQQGLAVFGVAGSHQWVVPDGVTFADVELIGAGGGSGSGGPGFGGSGGGGGGYSRQLIPVTEGQTFFLSVGAGGGGGAPGNGQPGGETWFASTAFRATGGFGGPADSSAGSQAGAGTGGQINLTGQRGNGGSAASQIAGVTFSGDGGGAPLGGLGVYGGRQSGNAFSNGGQGSFPGGGASGGGAGPTAGGIGVGAPGANGIVIIRYF